MQLNPAEISDLIKAKIENLSVNTEVCTRDTIISVTDGIMRIHGLSDAMQGEMFEFPGNTFGLTMNLRHDSVGVVMLGECERIRGGGTVTCTDRILEAPIGRELVGRVVDALGRPIGGRGPVNTTSIAPIEKIVPGVVMHKSVDQPVQTGLKTINPMVPVGCGQCELIIGDHRTGETAVTLDTIASRKGAGVIRTYVAIGQKASSIANIVCRLKEHGAMEHAIVVVTTASEAAALQYAAPCPGCIMGELFRDRGEGALIVYDDLSRQAVAYRQIPLLLHRPSGREAYPGNVFYLHSRLLERAARVSENEAEKLTNGEAKGKTGSLTVLPIIKAQADDVSASVPISVISITDGQILLGTDLFNAGIRLAIDADISVSRVDGMTQAKVIEKLGDGIRLASAQYRELAAFSQFASDLDEATRKRP